jgi:hypothetical protein
MTSFIPKLISSGLDHLFREEIDMLTSVIPLLLKQHQFTLKQLVFFG